MAEGGPGKSMAPKGTTQRNIRRGGLGRDALEGKGSRRRPQKRFGRRLEEVAKAVGGGYRRPQMPFQLAFAVKGTVAGHGGVPLRGGGGGLPRPLPMHPWVWDPKACVPEMVRSDFPDGKFRCFPRWSLWFGAGGGGGVPPSSYGVRPLPGDHRPLGQNTAEGRRPPSPSVIRPASPAPAALRR